MTDGSSAAAVRLFVAMALPETVRDEISRIQRELKPLVPRDVARWTLADQLHLTLRFLGDIPTDKIEELKAATGLICQQKRPFSLRAQGIGFFPNARSPRVGWIGVQDDENRLVDLQGRLEGALSRFSREPGEKCFTGHVTLVRLKSLHPAAARRLVDHAGFSGKHVLGNWVADEIQIIRSELTQAGARYTSLAAFRLDRICAG